MRSAGVFLSLHFAAKSALNPPSQMKHLPIHVRKQINRTQPCSLPTSGRSAIDIPGVSTSKDLSQSLLTRVTLAPMFAGKETREIEAYAHVLQSTVLQKFEILLAFDSADGQPTLDPKPF
jgi:hypothetical protein